MKKFILNVIAIVCISCMTYANTTEIKEPLNHDLTAIETVNNTVDEDTWLWCVAYYSETVYNDFDGSYTVTTYYACTEVSL
jgi:hypothetical protein